MPKAVRRLVGIVARDDLVAVDGLAGHRDLAHAVHAVVADLAVGGAVGNRAVVAVGVRQVHRRDHVRGSTFASDALLAGAVLVVAERYLALASNRVLQLVDGHEVRPVLPLGAPVHVHLLVERLPLLGRCHLPYAVPQTRCEDGDYESVLAGLPKHSTIAIGARSMVHDLADRAVLMKSVETIVHPVGVGGLKHAETRPLGTNARVQRVPGLMRSL